MSIQLDYNGAMAEAIGPRHGIEMAAIEALAPRAEAIHAELLKRRDTDLGFYDLPYDDALVKQIQTAAESLQWCENFVVLGIGGSALGPACVHTALRHNYHNLAPRAVRGGFPRLFVLDNSDPEILTRLFDVINVEETAFNVITKSGATPETMAQLMTIVETIAAKVGREKLAKHLIATTDREKGLLRPFVDANGLESFLVPDNVGGRFSVFTSVGLLPAAVEGVEIDRMLAGAREMDKRCQTADLMQNPAYLNAAIHYMADTEKGKSISVMMPYANALRDVADWYRQIWAESLGKAYDIEGREVHVGQTPVKALGATDQHSQVQLYAEGPNDKIFTFVETETFRASCEIPTSFEAIPQLDFLKGHDMGRLLNAELDATEFALAKNERPSVRVRMDALTPENVGGLLYMLEVQTAFSGGLYGINAFDQPGVEEGKKATAALMGRQSDADQEKRREIAAFQERKKYAAL